jgi:hypothetical protein
MRENKRGQSPFYSISDSERHLRFMPNCCKMQRIVICKLTHQPLHLEPETANNYF